MENRLERPGERRTIFALLDLLVLEGIYPSLSPGVGIPIERRARSFVLPQYMARPMPTIHVQEIYRDVQLLGRVVSGLLSVLGPGEESRSIPKDWKSPRGYPGVEGMVRERCLVDLIAGCGELAMSPETREENQAAWKEKLSKLMEGLVPNIAVEMMDDADALVVSASKLVPYCLCSCPSCTPRPRCGFDIPSQSTSQCSRFRGPTEYEVSLSSSSPQPRPGILPTPLLRNCRSRRCRRRPG